MAEGSKELMDEDRSLSPVINNRPIVKKRRPASCIKLADRFNSTENSSLKSNHSTDQGESAKQALEDESFSSSQINSIFNAIAPIENASSGPKDSQLKVPAFPTFKKEDTRAAGNVSATFQSGGGKTISVPHKRTALFDDILNPSVDHDLVTPHTRKFSCLLKNSSTQNTGEIKNTLPVGIESFCNSNVDIQLQSSSLTDHADEPLIKFETNKNPSDYVTGNNLISTVKKPKSGFDLFKDILSENCTFEDVSRYKNRIRIKRNNLKLESNMKVTVVSSKPEIMAKSFQSISMDDNVECIISNGKCTKIDIRKEQLEKITTTGPAFRDLEKGKSYESFDDFETLPNTDAFQTGSGKFIPSSKNSTKLGFNLFKDILDRNDNVECIIRNSKRAPKDILTDRANACKPDNVAFQTGSGKFIPPSKNGKKSGFDLFEDILNRNDNEECIIRNSKRVQKDILKDQAHQNNADKSEVAAFQTGSGKFIPPSRSGFNLFEDILNQNDNVECIINNSKRVSKDSINKFSKKIVRYTDQHNSEAGETSCAFQTGSGSLIPPPDKPLKPGFNLFEDILNQKDNVESIMRDNKRIRNDTQRDQYNTKESEFRGFEPHIVEESSMNAQDVIKSVDIFCESGKIIVQHEITLTKKRPFGDQTNVEQPKRRKTDADARIATEQINLATPSDKPKPRKRLGRSAVIRPNQLLTDSRIQSDNNIFNSTPVKSLQSTSTPCRSDISGVFPSTITPIKKSSRESTFCTVVGEIQDCLISDGRFVVQESKVPSSGEEFEKERLKLERKIAILRARQEAIGQQRNFQKEPPEGHRSLDSAVMITEDGATVIPNFKDLVGLPEIESAFLAMRGVNPQWVPRNWIENHYRLIVWKLLSYERFYASELGGCLNVENVVQQLKYRYDREIDKAERSALRKIMEKDDIPHRLMVLCVADILRTGNQQFELELTDGWYCVRTSIDRPLCHMIQRRKLLVGTKLVTCGATMLNCETACHPLDVPGNVRLQINFNSTRRALFDAKLGYQKVSVPFCVLIKTVNPEGGMVHRLKVFVARVYPLKYLEKQGSFNVWRNARADEKRARTWEVERIKEVERIQEVVRNDYQKLLQNKSGGDSFKNLKTTDLSDVHCPETLYNIFMASKDPEKLEESLTQCQRNAIIEYQRKEQQKLSDTMNQVSKREMSERDVTAVLKLLIVDVSERTDKVTVLQIWRPSQEHQEILKEGLVYNVFNVVPNPKTNNGDLSSSRKTGFEEAVPKVPPPHISNMFQRTLCPIGQVNSVNAICNEIDTVGVVIGLDVTDFQQKMWLADSVKNLLLVTIFDSPKNCLLLDSLSVGDHVAVSNLMLTRHCKETSYVNAVASHCTLVSLNPRGNHLRDGLEALKSEMTHNDMGEFLADCGCQIVLFGGSARRVESPLTVHQNVNSSSSVTDLCGYFSKENSHLSATITNVDAEVEEFMSKLDVEMLR